jgi:hypothetical protein
MARILHDLLAAAAKDALRAPSVLNTQPWSWRLDDEVLELHADRNRQLEVADPDGKLLLLSCGVALHHVRLSLVGAGRTATVRRLVGGFHDDLLARITVGQRFTPSARDRAMLRATWRRRTDRRPFADKSVSDGIGSALETAARLEGARLHKVHNEQMPMLAIAAGRASVDELADPSYRAELRRWLNRPEWSGDGVPAGSAVRRTARRVPVRELTLAPNEGMPVEPGGDRGAVYLVVYGDGDRARDWLVGGEAASAVLLTATSLGLAVSPMSDVIEVARPRQLVTRLLPAGGVAYLVIRCGWPAADGEPGWAPRRPAREAIVGLVEG